MVDPNKYILAFDPSINYTGWACLSNSDKLRESGLIKTWSGGDKGSDLDRLRTLMFNVQDLCEEYTPSYVVIEDYQWRHTDRTGRNKDYLKKLIWAISACMLGVPEGIPITLLRPQEWKGTKNKDKTKLECRAIFRVDKKINDNTCDAIMMAHHFVCDKLLQRGLF